jgi:hypothetical protein
MEPSQPHRALYCEGACRSVQPHAVLTTYPLPAGENLVARCTTCSRERRRSVIHAMTHDGRPSCESAGVPLGDASGKVNCEACLRQHEQRLTPLPEATHGCFRCKARQPHRMWGAIQLTRQEYVVAYCTACDERVETVGLNHLSHGNQISRCGLPSQRERKVLTDLFNVDCPACLEQLGPGHAMHHSDLPPRPLECRGCMGPAPHVLSVVVFDGLERLVGACQACGHRRAAGMLRHSSFEPGQTLCERTTGQLKVALRHDQVSCVTCLRRLLEDRLVLPVPDWRPAMAIGEDHYAL